MEQALSEKLSSEAILDLIRSVRNDLIKDYLDERNLRDYFKSRYNIPELSNVKIEFIKRDLRDFLIAPVDADHYKPIIDSIQQAGKAALAEGNDQLFYKDLESVFRNYTF